MASFRYQAIRHSGERVAGTIEGADRSLVLSRLQAQGLHPIDVAEEGAGSGAGPLSGLGLGLGRGRVGAGELTLFTRQLAWLLQAGTTLSRALDMLGRDAFSPALSAVLSAIGGDIRKGRSFHDALAAAGGFPPFYLSMVEVGEATGTLAAVLDRLATAREREEKLRAKAVSALAYPILLCVLSVGVVAFLMVAVVPGIKDMITGSGAPVPDQAAAVIAVSDWLIAHGALAGAGLAALVLLVALLWRSAGLARLLHAAALRLPLAGPLLMKSEVAGFCRVLGALSAAGKTLPESLRLIVATLPNRRIAAAASEMEAALRRGEDFIVPLERSGLLAPLLARMLKVGAETGNLTPSILRITQILEDDLDRLTDRTLALLGPVIILGLSVFVGFIIVSLMSAVISINDLAI